MPTGFRDSREGRVVKTRRVVIWRSASRLKGTSVIDWRCDLKMFGKKNKPPSGWSSALRYDHFFLPLGGQTITTTISIDG